MGELLPQTDNWREAVADAYDEESLYGAAAAFRRCDDPNTPGSVVYCHSCGWAKAVTHTCHLRTCPDCERRAQADRMEKYLPEIEKALNSKHKAYRLRHITITTPYLLTDPDIQNLQRRAWNIAKAAMDERVNAWLNGEDSLDGKERRSKSERRRSRVSWKKHGMGGLAGGEFGDDGWKFHIHILFYGCWIDAEKLTTSLRLLSDEEFFVNKVSLVNDVQAGSKEVLAKYATKLTTLPPSLVPTLHRALKGQRRIRSWGIFHGIGTDDEHCLCPECASGLTVDFLSSQGEWDVVVAHGVEVWLAWMKPTLVERVKLNLIHGNKYGGLSPPKEAIPPPMLPGFNVGGGLNAYLH